MEYKESEDALVAIQGPKAAAVVEKLTGVSFKKQLFMEGSRQKVKALNIDALFTRCGYTGEDGFEVAIKASKAAEFCELLRSNNVEPCGLGARDSLRLEAGLCLYGHELDETISPVEAVLQWVITPRRRTEGGFIGHSKYMEIRKKGVTKKRVGFLYSGTGPAA